MPARPMPIIRSGASAWCLGEEAVLIERFLEAAGVGQQLCEVVANDLFVVRLIESSVRDGLLEIAERVVVGAGFKFAKTAQRHGGDGGGHQLQQVGEGVDGAGELIGAVLEDAEIPPALLPVGLELLGLGVELDGEGQVLLVAGGGGAGGQVVELCGSR